MRKFCLRSGSGGEGEFRGGDGVSRYLQFRRGLQLSILTERRVFSPYGLFGGRNGTRGINTLKKGDDGRRINVGAKCSIKVEAGVSIFSYLFKYKDFFRIFSNWKLPEEGVLVNQFYTNNYKCI